MLKIDSDMWCELDRLRSVCYALQIDNENLRARREAIERRIFVAKELELNKLKLELAEERRVTRAMIKSLSWKVTAPLRWAKIAYKRVLS